MNAKMETPTGADTLARAKGGFGNVRFGSCGNYTTSQDFRQDYPVANLLRHGADYATSARELAAFLNWPPRMVTRQIERERRAGIPICANSAGYFLPSSDVERDFYIASLAHREAEIRRTRAAVAATRQTTIDLRGGGEA